MHLVQHVLRQTKMIHHQTQKMIGDSPADTLTKTRAMTGEQETKLPTRMTISVR
jgi:hypothetical protein